MSLSKLAHSHTGYTIMSQNPNKQIIKTKRRTAPHALTLEFADRIVKHLFNDIKKVVFRSSERSMWLLRFPILYGSIKEHFTCHRSELEQYIEYARAWVIQEYSKQVSRAYTKTPSFRRKINHFSQVKMRNILYAMSNTHSCSLGIFKVVCGHTIVWYDTMYNTAKSVFCKKIEDIDSYRLMANIDTQTLHAPTNNELYYDRFDRYEYMAEDNQLRNGLGIETELEY